MINLRRLAKVIAGYLTKRYKLFLAVLLLSLHQATIVAYGEYGQAALFANSQELEDAFIPNAFVFRHIQQLGIQTVGFRIMADASGLFLIQAIPAVIYSGFSSIRGKRIAALAICLSPLVPCLLNIEFIAVYLMSLFGTIATLPVLMFLDLGGPAHKEIFAEGWTFPLAAMGWFNLFWLAMTIKAWRQK